MIPTGGGEGAEARRGAAGGEGWGGRRGGAAAAAADDLFEVHKNLELLSQNIASLAKLVLFVLVEILHLTELFVQFLEIFLYLY